MKLESFKRFFPGNKFYWKTVL